MPKLSGKEFSDAIEEYDKQEFRRQFRIWLRWRTNPPACPECDFEDEWYCEEHEQIAKEVLSEECVSPEIDRILQEFFNR